MVKNVDILGTRGSAANLNAATDYGLQIRGQGDVGGTAAAGNVRLENVRIAGNYRRAHLGVQRYSDASGVQMSAVQLGGALQNVSVGSGGARSVLSSAAGFGKFFSSDQGGALSLGNTRFLASAGELNPLDINIGGETNALRVDATGTAFFDADGSQRTDNFAIERRVQHATDSTALGGVVSWRAGSVYVTNDRSIQRGVDVALASETVNVQGGIYAEDVVVGQPRNLLFNDSQIRSLTLEQGAAGSGVGGRVTATDAGGFLFNAPVVLLGDTSLATTGAGIVLNGDIRGLGGAAYALSLDAGSGDVFMVSGGSSGNPLGRLEVDANNFSLQGTLWVSGYDIDALGSVALSSSTLRSVGGGGTDAINAGGDVTGSTISESALRIDSGGSVNVAVQTPAPVEIHAEGPAHVSGSAPVLFIDAPGGSASGDFGQVTNAGGGLIEVNGRPQVNTTVAETASNNRVVPQEITTAASPEASAPQRGGTTLRRRRKPEDALDVLENGEAMEIDLTPG